jgi:lambda family phage portal protein
MGVSYNALASDLEGVNYSSMRSGLLIERDQWRICQSLMKESFLQPIFEYWISMALLSGALALDSRDPSRFTEGKWKARGWQWVDPLKDTQANTLAINAGLTSRSACMAEEGEDAEDAKLAESFGLDFETADAKAPTVDKGPKETVEAEGDDTEANPKGSDSAGKKRRG